MLTISVNDALKVFEKENTILNQITDQITTHSIPFIDGKLPVVVMGEKEIGYVTAYENKEATLPDMSYFEYNDEEWSYQVVEINGYWFIEVYDEENEFVSYWGG